jgi:hypothetical protein
MRIKCEKIETPYTLGFKYAEDSPHSSKTLCRNLGVVVLCLVLREYIKETNIGLPKWLGVRQKKERGSCDPLSGITYRTSH